MSRTLWMRCGLVALLSFVGLLPLVASAQKRQGARPPQRTTAVSTMTNQDVIKLVRAGISDDIVITKIKQSRTKFDLSTDGLVQLKTAGVSERVLAVMMNPDTEATSPAKPAQSAAPQTHSGIAKNSAPAKSIEPSAATPEVQPTHAALERVANARPGTAMIRPKPTPAPRPKTVINTAPQNFGLYVEQGGKLVPVGRIQTKVQHSKWRSLLATKVPFVRQKIDINIPGAHSDSRFDDRRPNFYAFFPPGRDVSKFKLLHCKITGQGFDQRTVSNLSIMFSREQNQDEILCDIGPTGAKDLYRITPREDLPSGEYGFVEGNPGAQSAENVQIIDVWDFGVDLKEDKLGINEYLDRFSLLSKGDVSFLNWSKDEAQRIVDAHAGSEDVRGTLQGWFKRQFSSLGVYWMDEQFAKAFARLEMLDRNLTPEQATKLAALLTDVDEGHYYVLVTLGQKIGSGRLIGANEAERRMRPFDAVLYNAKDDDFIVPAKKMEGLGGYAAVWKVTFDKGSIKGPVLNASPDIFFEARLNQNLDLKAKFRVEQISSKLAQVTQ
ncbi:MAG TPA: hypothetical protein VEF04_23060 [Blastocatellia bacterium]|nr:hypothetical protein [Blastocatellia bacterium]